MIVIASRRTEVPAFYSQRLFSSIPTDRFFELFAGIGIGLCLRILDFGVFGWFAKK
jgi:hypothetical protein